MNSKFFKKSSLIKYLLYLSQERQILIYLFHRIHEIHDIIFL